MRDMWNCGMHRKQGEEWISFLKLIGHKFWHFPSFYKTYIQQSLESFQENLIYYFEYPAFRISILTGQKILCPLQEIIIYLILYNSKHFKYSQYYFIFATLTPECSHKVTFHIYFISLLKKTYSWIIFFFQIQI